VKIVLRYERPSWKLKPDTPLSAFTAAHAPTLSVNGGEVVDLLGSNGAGKTHHNQDAPTLLPPSSGERRVAGFSITTQGGKRSPRHRLLNGVAAGNESGCLNNMRRDRREWPAFTR